VGQRLPWERCKLLPIKEYPLRGMRRSSSRYAEEMWPGPALKLVSPLAAGEPHTPARNITALNVFYVEYTVE
jgi:hypothetical protein